MNKRAKNKHEKDFAMLTELAKEIGRAATTVEKFPDVAGYSLKDLDVLEEVRGEALRLARECEAVFTELRGGN